MLHFQGCAASPPVLKTSGQQPPGSTDTGAPGLIPLSSHIAGEGVLLVFSATFKNLPESFVEVGRALSTALGVHSASAPSSAWMADLQCVG